MVTRTAAHPLQRALWWKVVLPRCAERNETLHVLGTRGRQVHSQSTKLSLHDRRGPMGPTHPQWLAGSHSRSCGMESHRGPNVGLAHWQVDYLEMMETEQA